MNNDNNAYNSSHSLGEEENFQRTEYSNMALSTSGAIPLLLMMSLTLFSDKDAIAQTTQQFTNTIGELQLMLDSLKTTLSSLEQAYKSWNSFEIRYR